MTQTDIFEVHAALRSIIEPDANIPFLSKIIINFVETLKISAPLQFKGTTSVNEVDSKTGNVVKSKIRTREFGIEDKNVGYIRVERITKDTLQFEILDEQQVNHIYHFQYSSAHTFISLKEQTCVPWIDWNFSVPFRKSSFAFKLWRFVYKKIH